MRIPLIALCALGCAASGVSAAEATHDVHVPTLGAASNKHNNEQFKSVTTLGDHAYADDASLSSYSATSLRGRASFVSTTSDRILKEDDQQDKNGIGEAQETGCDKAKDCEKATKEAEKAKEKAEKEAAKAAEEAAKASEKAAEEAAEASEKAAEEAAEAFENEDGASEEIAPEDGTAQDTPTQDTDTSIDQDQLTSAEVTTVLVEEEADLLAPTDNVDEITSNTDEKDESATEQPFVAVVPPKSVKEDLGDDNKAILPPPTDETIIFDTIEEEDTTITITDTLILENEGSGMTNSQNNKPTVVEVDGFPGPVKKDEETSLTFSSSSIKSANDDGLQPVGKALLSVTLAGVFAAFVAIFLLRRQRRHAADSAYALAITPYYPSKDDSYFVDRDEGPDDADVDVEKQLVLTDTAASSPVQTPEKVSALPDGEHANGDDNEDESSQPSSFSYCENAVKFLSMLPCQIDISPCANPTMIEASTSDEIVPAQPDLRVVAAPSSEMEEEESGKILTRNNTACALMRKYQVDDTVNF